MTRFLAAIAVLFALFIAFVLFWVGDAFGHSFYDAACCSDKDCAPISDDEVSEVPGGYFLKTRNEFIHFKETRQGKDDQYHICINEHTGSRICFYRKYSGS